MEDSKIILFGPRSGKSLTRLYPELSNEPKFKSISSEDLLFAWYVGCQSSPIDPDWIETVRYSSAALTCIKDEKKRKSYASGDIPEKVKEAIERMKTYSPDARMLAKRMIQKTFYNWQQIIDIDPKTEFLITKRDKEGNEITETDWTAKKQYVDSTEKISSSLPSLISQIEQGFGIEEKEKETGKKMIDKFHQEKRE